MGEPTEKPARRWKEKLAQLFGIDLRSLALFRVGLSLAILGDLLARLPDLEAFYTDGGVLPRSILPIKASIWKLSPYLLGGSTTFQALMFLLTGISALALLIGYRTRLATFACWLLMVSLHLRNPSIHQSGDILLHLYLFWGLFLPLGARASLDRILDRGSPIESRVFSGGSVALLLQVCFVYWFAGINKTGEAWREGDALYRILQTHWFSGSMGRSLLEYPELVKFLSHFTMGLERWGPLLAFMPVFTSSFRTLAVGLFLSFHVGTALFLNLGAFPYICMVGWLVFLPGEFWKWASRCARSRGVFLRRLQEKIVSMAWAVGSAFGGKLSPQGRPVSVRLPRWADVLALVLLAYVLLLNFATVNVPAYRLDFMRGFMGLGEALRLNQAWGMFAPEPSKMDFYYKVSGELLNGTGVEISANGRLFTTGDPPSSEIPPLRWRKYLDWISHGIHAEYQPYYGEFLCRKWNSRPIHETKLGKVQIFRVKEDISLAGGGSFTEKTLLYTQDCP